jgi:amino acid adenylation domain-containing protein
VIETGTESALNGIPLSWNLARSEYPKQECIHTLFAEQVALTPNVIALEFGGATFTYAALNQMANAIASFLVGLQLKPGTRVAVSQERSPEFVASLFGILKSGGVYVPIDLAYPDERLKFLLNDASASFVLGSANQKSAIERLGVAATFINLPDLNSRPLGESANFAAAASPTDPAYIMYTSGSTGTPKGVIINHRSVVRLVCNTNYVEITPHDVFLQLAPGSFDASTFEIFAPLLNGARLAIAPAGDLSLTDIAGLIERHRVSILWLTAGLFHAMVDERPQALRNVRRLLSGGEVLSAPHVRRALTAIEDGCVINGYGPTENTTFTCCFRVTRDTEFNGPVPIGTPIANSSVYILNSDLRPVSVGEVGEIFIGGDGLALGYLNQPELEREKFIVNPFGADGDDRLYRSGDLGRFTPSGDIEFCGRVDDQVKVRGYRIEVGEIEAAVMRFTGIAQAIVLPVLDQSGDKSLKCNYVTKPECEIDHHELRSHLALLLPPYMVPSHYQRWSAFPLTANGKVERRRLLESSIPVQPPAAAAPEGLGAMEETLLDMFRSLLGRQDLSIDDDFFAIGGHSLAAARLFARIEERFGKRLPLATMFEAPSARQLAATLRNKERLTEWSPLVPIRASGARTPVFLVHAIGGNVLTYKHLHSHLGPDQPIYGLQAVALKDGRMASTTIEEVARSYVAALRSVQPRGPYFLGGFSAGGMVAYEMAQQLVRVGQDVATVLLLDSYVESSAIALFRSLRLRAAISRVFRTFLWNLSFGRRTGLRSFVRQKTHNLSTNLRIALYQSLNAGALALRATPPKDFLTVEEAFILALENYVPEPYDGPAVLLRTKDSNSYHPRNAGLWSKLVKRLEVVGVPGDHDSMFQEPNVKVLANIIASYLEGGGSRASENLSLQPGLPSRS